MKNKLFVFFLVITMIGTGALFPLKSSAAAIAVTSLKMSTSSVTIMQGASFKLAVTINPSKATNKTINWSSSNKAVATISSNGTIKAIKAGSCTITAKSNNNKAAKCSVKVKAPPVTITSINVVNITTTAGNAPDLPETVTANMSDKTKKSYNVTWSYISPSKYANAGTFTVNGIVSGTTINATATITVTAPPITITSIKAVNITITAGTPPILPSTVTVTMSDGTTKSINVTWSNIDSSQYANSGTFTVNGTVSGTTLNATATITVTASSSTYWPDGKYKVGSDIPAGEYVEIGAETDGNYGNFEIDDTAGNIITNDYFSGRDILTVTNGEYLTIDSGELYPIASAPKVDTSSGKLSDGMYKVGTDIPAGKYTLTSTDSTYEAFYQVANDSLHLTSSNIDCDLFWGTKTITVTNGEYLSVSFAQLTLPQTMTDSQFQQYLNTNYGSLTLDGKTITFDWNANDYEAGTDDEVDAVLDNSQYSIWLDWCSNGDYSEIKSYLTSVFNAMQNNYPNKTLGGGVFYIGDFTSNPSNYYSSNEISYNSTTGNWDVCHLSAGFDNSNGVVVYDY